MTQITRVPFGLQDFLGSKSFGQNPSQLAQVVAPILTLDDFLAAERRTFTISSNVVVVGNGSFASTTVPDGELWLLDAVGVRIALNGGAPGDAYFTCTIVNAINHNSPTNATPIAEFGRFEGQTVSGAGVAGLTYDFPKPMPVFAGETLSSSPLSAE